MIILIFVPFIIIVPIPIIPFILPIPLKILLLIPFQKLTDRGLLPLMRRIILGFMSEDTYKHFIKSNYDVYGFFYDSLKVIMNDILIINEPQPEKISKGIQDDKYKTSTIDDENEESSNEIMKSESGNVKMTKKIKEEYLLCVKSQRAMNKYGEDNGFNNSMMDNKNSFECNLDNMKTYLKIKI